MIRTLVFSLILVSILSQPVKAKGLSDCISVSDYHNYTLYFPVITKGGTVTTAFEHIENLVRQPADFPFDGWALEVFPESVTVKVVGSNQIKRNVLIPSHISPNDIRKGMPVRLGEQNGQPMLLAIFPQLQGDINYAGKGSIIPGPPNVSVAATKDGWLVSWSPVGGTNRYRVYRNDTPDETSPNEVCYINALSLVVPYESNFIWFAVKSVSGLNESQLSGWVTDNTAPPVPNTFDAEIDLQGHRLLISSLDVSLNDPGFKNWEIEQADDGAGTGSASLGLFGFSDFPMLVSLPPCSEKWYRIRSIDYAGNTSDWTAWLEVSDTTPPPVPDTFDAEDDIQGHRLLISASDVSLADSSFTYWEIEQADDGSGTNSVSLGLFGPSDFPMLVPHPQGTTKYYRVRSVDCANNLSSWTAWEPAFSIITGIGQTIQDKFDSYGGRSTTPLESLYWLQLLQGMDSGTWEYHPLVGSPIVSSIVSSTTRPLEGNTHLHKSSGQTGIAGQVSTLDLTQDGRFTNDDYVIVHVAHDTVWIIDGDTFTVRFYSDAARTKFYEKQFSLQGDRPGSPPVVNGNGLYYSYSAKKSEFTAVNSPNWATIVAIGISAGANVELDFDDIRLVKADPDDSTKDNDTGLSWDKAANTGSDTGLWHIYPGNRTGEPSKPFSLGQVKTATTPGVWYLAHKPLATNIVSGTIQAGMYIKGADGKAGLSFFVKDVTAGSWDMYALEADSAGNTIKLVKWVAGVRTEIASTSFSFNPNQILWLGADFRDYDSDGGRIKVFASLSEGNLIQASRMVISEQDTQWLGSAGGSVGVLSYQANTRFINFVAGSPAHSDVADVALALDGPVMVGEGRRVRANSDTFSFEYSDDGSTWKHFGSLVGELKIWPTDTAPAGWLLCYGQAVSRTTYSTLFSIIGTTFGSGDGSTTFNLPDLRGRVPLGQDDMGGSSANRVTAAAADSIGGSGGEESHTLTSSELPAHTHDWKFDNVNLAGGGLVIPGANGVGRNTYSVPMTGSSGGAHNNMQPYLALNYIIFSGV